MGKFTPKEENFQAMFMPRTKYVVPKFQREYAWKDEKIYDFWDDLIRNYENAIKSSSSSPENQYFLGSMVILTETDNNVKQLIDGQQRMATFTIFLCLARDWLKKISTDQNSSYEAKETAITNQAKISNYIQNDQDDGTLDDYKLELNERNKKYFKDLVQTPGIPDDKIANLKKINSASEKNIWDCYDIFNKKLETYLKDKLEEKIPQTLYKLVNLSLEFLSIISISVTKEEDAFDIFETLNQRGQRLALGDLVKNNLLKNTQESKRDNIDTNWGKMMTYLGDDSDIDQFLRYSWFSRKFFNDGKLIKNDLFKVIKNNVKDSTVETYVDELLIDSEIYQAIVNSKKYSDFWCEDKTIIQNLTALHDLDASYVIPTIMTAYRVYKNALPSLKEIIRLVLVYFFRFKIIGVGHANDVQTTMVNTCMNISGFDENTKKSKTFTIDDLREKLELQVDDDDKFKKLFSEKTIKKHEYVKYILKEIETVLAGKRNDELSVENLTLEHIIPKNHKDHWTEFFDENKIKNPDTLVYRLGNQTIVTKKMNSSMSDNIFKNKLNMYKESMLELNKQTVCNEIEWTDVIIDKRQKTFADKAVEIWKF